MAAAGDALAHRITYLEQALAHLDALGPDQRLLAVTLSYEQAADLTATAGAQAPPLV
ncbi:hypothetical protein [Micromonospora fulviviridis]|uniref:Uncharacterized protein n=1 Tax=Micromonospora fulviviridis TaxID=47860 RepID=A0ABV2VTZ9_9ACTN